MINLLISGTGSTQAMHLQKVRSRRSNSLLEDAATVLPGAVASPNRLVSQPVYFVKAKGAELTDNTGKTYTDYNCAFGATILGHGDPQLAEIVAEASAEIGLVGLGGTDIEVALAEKLVRIIPCAEQIIYCNSGSEATFQALRVARAATGRNKVIKFQGAYHGFHDSVALNVASAANAIGAADPLSTGLHPGVLADTLVSEFNDLQALQTLFDTHEGEIAAVIVETILHNVGCIPSTKEFLQGAKDLCEKHGAVLIFDEMITGFRHALGGYQEIIGVTPHLATFGKAMANGFPIAALVGSEALMQLLQPKPAGDVFHAGTYNGHPAMAAAALATIARLEEPGTYKRLYELGARYRDDLKKLIKKYDLPAQPAGFGTVWLLEWFKGEKSGYTDLLANDSERDTAFRAAMFDRGQATSTVPLKRWNITLAHSDVHREKTMAAADRALAEMLDA